MKNILKRFIKAIITVVEVIVLVIFIFFEEVFWKLLIRPTIQLLSFK